MNYATQSFDFGSIGSSKNIVGSSNTKMKFKIDNYDYIEEPDYSQNVVGDTSNEIKKEGLVQTKNTLEKWQYKGVIKLGAESFATIGTYTDKLIKLGLGENSKAKSMAATAKFVSFIIRGKLTGDIEGTRSGVITTFKDTFKQVFNDHATKGLTNTLKNMMKIPAKGSTEEAIKKAFTDIVRKKGSSIVVKNIGATAGVNIVTNVVFKWVDNMFKYGSEEGTKKFIKEDAADQIFKGTVTTIFSVAGNILGGLSGGGLIKMAFSAAGVAVSEWAVEQYETEWGLLVASGAMVAGAIVGYAAGAAIATTFLASNPIGWTIAAVGTCLLVGAAVGATIVWAIEKLVLNWEEIYDSGAKCIKNFVNFTLQKAEEVIEYVGGQIEEAAKVVEEAVSVVVEEVKEGWENFRKGCESLWNWALG